MDRHKVTKSREWSGSRLLGWKLLSFFSLDAAEQLKLCGEAEDWFCRESTHRNAGANYLFGCILAAVDYVGVLQGVVEDEDACEQAAYVEEFLLELERLPARENASVWSFAALSSAAAWERLRRLARAAMSTLDLHPNPPRRPFVIDEMIEVMCYRTATKFRRCPGLSGVQTAPSSPVSVSKVGDE